jgi:hypothetical protein
VALVRSHRAGRPRAVRRHQSGHPLGHDGASLRRLLEPLLALLFEAGLVPEPLTFEDDDRLPEFGFGITNIVPRPTPGIDTIARTNSWPAAPG